MLWPADVVRSPVLGAAGTVALLGAWDRILDPVVSWPLEGLVVFLTVGSVDLVLLLASFLFAPAGYLVPARVAAVGCALHPC